MDFIVAVTVKQYQIGGGIVVMVAVPMMDFEQVFCHEALRQAQGKLRPQCKQRPDWFLSKAITRLDLEGSFPRRSIQYGQSPS